MVGTAADGQLIARPARHDVRFAVATPADDAALRRLLRETPMRGRVSVTFEREPDYFRGCGVGGAEDRTIVAFDRGRLGCMGRCTTREMWLNGAVRRVGYLGELRLAADARGRLDILRGGYRFFRELQRDAPADSYFTSIAADNRRARTLLERGVTGLPRYDFLTELTTLLIPTSGLMGARVVPHSPPRDVGTREGRWIEDQPPHPGEIASFLNACAQKHHLTPVWTETILASLRNHDLRTEDFAVIRRAGQIVACGALWDQRNFRQTVVRDYSTPLRLARPLINAAHAVFGNGRLPPRGSTLAQAFLSPLAFADSTAATAIEFVDAFRARAAARGLDYLTVALPSHDTLLGALRTRFHGRAYTTRLYRVAWPDDPPLALDERPLRPEVALL